MSRGLLRVVVAVLAINALAGGSLCLVLGLKGLSVLGIKLSVEPNDLSFGPVDYVFRALAGVWFGLGLMLGWLVFCLERQTTWFRFACLAMFLMGVGRLLSVLALGVGSNPMVAMVLELVVPPLLLVWQGKVAKTAVACVR